MALTNLQEYLDNRKTPRRRCYLCDHPDAKAIEEFLLGWLDGVRDGKITDTFNSMATGAFRGKLVEGWDCGTDRLRRHIIEHMKRNNRTGAAL